MIDFERRIVPPISPLVMLAFADRQACAVERNRLQTAAKSNDLAVLGKLRLHGLAQQAALSSDDAAHGAALQALQHLQVAADGFSKTANVTLR